MPMFNSESYIEEAVSSILSQTFADFELIIIDDASTDRSCSIVEGISDPRIKLIKKSCNTGYTVSLNMGLDLVKSEFIARMDSDDISLPLRFERQIQFLQSNPDVVCVGTDYKILGRPITISNSSDFPSIALKMIDECPLAHPTVMMRSSPFIGNRGLRYNDKLEPAEDYDLWVRLSQIGKLANINEVLLHYRSHPNQTTRTRSKIQIENTNKIRRVYINNLTDSDVVTENLMIGRFTNIMSYWKYCKNERVLLKSFKSKMNIDASIYLRQRRRKIWEITMSYIWGKVKIPISKLKKSIIRQFKARIL